MQYDQDIVDLFQDYCSHHEIVYHFSPLTAQIYTYIMFNNNRDGITFDEIVEKLNASKSSVSTSLNLLTSNNQIEHFNKIDERKRFFRLNPNFIIIRLQSIKDLLNREQALSIKMLKYLKNENINMNNCQKKIDIYITHLDGGKDHLRETIEQLKSIN